MMKYIRKGYCRGELVHSSVVTVDDKEAQEIMKEYRVSTPKQLIDRWNSLYDKDGRFHQHTTWFYNLLYTA